MASIFYPEDSNDIPVVGGGSLPGAGAGLTQPTSGGDGWLRDIGMGLGLFGVFSGANAASSASAATKTALLYQAAMERNRAQVATWQASDAITRGQTAAGTSRLKYAAVAGSQRAAAAAGNKALDEGSPYNIGRDTQYLSNVDAATIEDNAAKEAWALRISAQTSSSNAAFLESRAAAESPGRAGLSSLMSGAGQVAANWYRFRSGAA